MSDLTYEPGDLEADVRRAVGTLEVMTLSKGLSFKVTMSTDSKVVKEVQTDKLLAAELWLGVGAIYKDLVERISQNLKTTDRGAVKLRNDKEVEKLKKLVEVVNKGIVGAAKVAEETAKKSVEKNFENLKKKRKEYTKYKVKIAVTITGAVAGLATSIALLAASGFSGGASGALGIIAMVKSVAVIGTEVVSAAQSVEQSMATLKLQINALYALWGKAKANGARAHANEIAGAVFKEFIGMSPPTAKQCAGNLDTAQNKLGGLEVRTHDMAKKVVGLMNQSAVMQKEFIDKANQKLAKHPDPQALQKYGPRLIAQLQKAVKPGNDAIKTLVLGIDRNIKRIDAAKVEMAKLAKEVEEINKVRNANKWTENAYKLLDNSLAVANNLLLGALSGNGLVEGAKSITENVAPVATLFVYDKISAVVFAEGDLKKALW